MSSLRVYLLCVLAAFVFLLISIGATLKYDPSYVDPTDVLNFDAINMRMKDHKQHPDSTDTATCSKAEKKSEPSQIPNIACQQCPPCPKATEDSVCAEVKEKQTTSTSLLRQYSLSLVTLIEAQVRSVNQKTLLDVRVVATYQDLTKLRKFGNGSSSDFHSLYETLTSLMQYAKPAAKESFFSRFYWLEDKLGLSFPMMAYVIILILSTLLLVVAIGHMRWRKELLWKSLFSVFIFSVVLTMIEMYQEKIAEQEELLMETIKIHCPKMEEMTLWERVFSFVSSSVYFKDDKCKKYMKAMLVHPMVAVSPLQAIAVALVNSVVTPMELIGMGIKGFLIGLLKDLPVHIQPFVLVCLFCLLILWPLLLMGYNFNLFYLINIGPARIVRDIQCVTAKPASSDTAESLDWQPTGSRGQINNPTPDLTGHKDSQIVLPTETRNIISHSVTSIQPVTPQFRQVESSGFEDKSTFTKLAREEPAPQRMEDDGTAALYRRPYQRDGGDTQKGVVGSEGVQDREVISSQALACGDRESSELTTVGLCQKLDDVHIS